MHYVRTDYSGIRPVVLHLRGGHDEMYVQASGDTRHAGIHVEAVRGGQVRARATVSVDRAPETIIEFARALLARSPLYYRTASEREHLWYL